MGVTVLAGGVGAARFLAGLVQVVPPHDITAVVNVGDDFELHGLSISPDLDTVTYTLAGAIDPERGWGLRDETWNAMAMLTRLGRAPWFNLGDADLGTHLYRTERRQAGVPLSAVTAEIAAAWGLGVRLLPVSDDAVRTRVTLAEDDLEVGFQEYFVERRHQVPISAVRFAGADAALPAPGVIDAIEQADALVVAPSNPLVSIAPVLAVPGVREAVEKRRAHTVAVSPIVDGAALKGPADRMLRELGHDPSVTGVARLYREVADALVIDAADAARAPEVRALGLRCTVTDTIMRDERAAAELARTTLGAVGATP